MSILVDKSTKLVVQGITGREGAFHTKLMLDYGTNVVAGVTPGKGGQQVHRVPVFDTVKEAVEKTNADTSIIYVPARFALDAIYEACYAGIKLIICITEGISTIDMIKAVQILKQFGVKLIGPNCPGIISPGKAKVGIMPGEIHIPGKVGLVSRSGTLTYEIVDGLTRNNIGQSTVVGMGGDPVIGLNFIDYLEMFENDAETEVVVLVGEIGGSDEENAAEFIGKNMKKPVVGFIAGRFAPPGKRMGHAGAIISGSCGRAEDKIKALESAGIPVGKDPEEVVELVKKYVKR